MIRSLGMAIGGRRGMSQLDTFSSQNSFKSIISEDVLAMSRNPIEGAYTLDIR